jgi:hypothetical protein
MLYRQVGADFAFAEGALDIAAGRNGQVHASHPLVGLLVKAGVALHNAFR